MSDKVKIDEMLEAFGMSEEDFAEMFSDSTEVQDQSQNKRKKDFFSENERFVPIPPKNETIFERYIVNNEVRYAVTAGPMRDVYYLCTVEKGKCIKTGQKSANPRDLSAIVFGDT